MIRSLVLAWALCLALSWTAQAQTPDERYVGIYHLIQEADALNDAGKTREAVSRYVEAQNALKDFQSTHPSWNERIVKFRLDYVAARLEPLSRRVGSSTNAVPSIVVTTNVVAPGTSLTNQLDELQAEIKRLTGQNVLLEAKLKEALSVQPPAMDARELARAEQKINELTKERDLLKVALEQQKGTAMKLSDTAAVEAERKLLVEVQRKLEDQTKENAALRKEAADLRKQLSETKPQLEMPVGERNELAGQLQIARATITSLQSSNLALLNQQILLQQQLAEARKTPANAAAVPADVQKQLELAQARLQIYEARQTPYTTQELALLKQPDVKASLASTNVPAKRTRELPAGAGPLMAEAQRAMDAGRFEEAERKLRDILRQDEKNPYVLGTLAAAQMEQNRHNEAEATIKQALASDPTDPASLLMMGLIKYQQGQYDAALDSLSLAAKGAPEDPRAQYFLGKTLLQKGMRSQAETALRKAIGLRPGWGEAHFSLAMTYATQQPPFKELAQWHYQKAIAGGYPRNQEFERMVAEKKSAALP